MPPLKYDEHENYQRLIAASIAGTLRGKDDRALLGELHAKHMKDAPRPLRVMPSEMHAGLDVENDPMLVKVDALEPIGSNMATDIRMGQGRISWPSEGMLTEYVSAHEKTLADLWSREVSELRRANIRHKTCEAIVASAAARREPSFRAERTHFVIVRGDARWDAREVMKLAGIRIVSEHNRLVCEWWIKMVGCARLLLRWALHEQHMQGETGLSAGSLWTDSREPRSELAAVLFASATEAANRKAESLSAHAEFWDRYFAKKEGQR